MNKDKYKIKLYDQTGHKIFQAKDTKVQVKKQLINYMKIKGL